MRPCTLVRRAFASAFWLAFSSATLATPPLLPRSVEINALSNRADLISGGDALVEVRVPVTLSAQQLALRLNGQDVTHQFTYIAAERRFVGLLTGLVEGPNEFVAEASGRVRGRPHSSLTITNHPKGGPIFSGPQRMPWICMTELNGLGPAQDAQCNAPGKIEYFYRSTNPANTGFLPYNPASPPTDVATTTTDQGATVPFIVRRERGTLNRYIYDIAVLAEPAAQVSPWQPPAAWNRKLYYVYQGGALPQHIQGVVPDVFHQRALSRGFAVATSSGNVFGTSTNSVTSAEVTMMVKERVVESLGEIRYTLAEGSSGGSMQQHLIANAYPGLLDGIQPSLSYQDIWTTNNEVQDCSLLLRYFDANAGLWTNEAQRNAVMHNAIEQPGTCRAWISEANLFGLQLTYLLDRAWMDPTSGSSYVVNFSTGLPSGIGLPETRQPWMYDPVTNPTGVRSTLQDYQVNIFGRRPDGFANRPYDNVGIQYGLMALEAGSITPEQFVHLNENVGGRDIDWRWTAERSTADTAGLRVVYRSGQVNLGTGLASIPVIDNRSCFDFEIHSCYHSWVVRERLKKTNGNADNHVILVTALTDAVGAAAMAAESFELLDRWVAAIKADTSKDAEAVKVARHRPAQAQDACWINGVRTTDQAACRVAHPYFGDPRTGAGEPITIDVMKCRTKPLKRSDYGVSFTEAQWTRLKVAFPEGVCDWTKSGVGFKRAVPWLTYEDGPGGKPLRPVRGEGNKD